MPKQRSKQRKKVKGYGQSPKSLKGSYKLNRTGNGDRIIMPRYGSSRIPNKKYVIVEKIVEVPVPAFIQEKH